MSLYINIHTHHPTNRHIEPLAVGIHPWSAESTTFNSKIFDDAVAIGEIGLDFACDVDREAQEYIFRLQLKEAEKRKLPIILHCVRAFEPMMKILEEYNLRGVIFHGFVGSVQQAQRAVNRGYYLSFGPTSFRSRKSIVALQNIPISSLFAETDDSDDMIENIYLKLSQIRNISTEELHNAIENNYKNIFTYHNE